MQTGWFGIPGKSPSVSNKVHVFDGSRTLCGWTPKKPYEFQMCASGIHLKMVECSKCKETGVRILSFGK